MRPAPRPRFSGHESFACRFTWLPKAVRLIEADPSALCSDDEAIFRLGLGKNMVRSIRFWLEAFEIAALENGSWSLLPFGQQVLASRGFDPFIERIETQWLLHWVLTSKPDEPLFAWRHVFGRRSRPDFTRSELLAELRRESAEQGFEHSDVTLLQHIDVLLHTYVASSGHAAPEDVLDGPLVDLRLLSTDGRRRGSDGRTETVYVLSATAIADVGSRVVDFTVADFCVRWRNEDSMVSLRDLAYAEGSPGSAFRLSIDELQDHVEAAAGQYGYRASADAGAILTSGARALLQLAGIYA
jgi:hypothetical protein